MPVTSTASSKVSVIEIVSPILYVPSVAATAVMSGVSPSTITDPRSPDAAPALEPSSSAVIVPE